MLPDVETTFKALTRVGRKSCWQLMEYDGTQFKTVLGIYDQDVEREDETPSYTRLTHMATKFLQQKMRNRNFAARIDKTAFWSTD